MIFHLIGRLGLHLGKTQPGVAAEIQKALGNVLIVISSMAMIMLSGFAGFRIMRYGKKLVSFKA